MFRKNFSFNNVCLNTLKPGELTHFKDDILKDKTGV